MKKLISHKNTLDLVLQFTTEQEIYICNNNGIIREGPLHWTHCVTKPKRFLLIRNFMKEPLIPSRTTILQRTSPLWKTLKVISNR